MGFIPREEFARMSGLARTFDCMQEILELRQFFLIASNFFR